MPQANNQVGQRCSKNHTGDLLPNPGMAMPVAQLLKIIVPIVCVFALIVSIPSITKSVRYYQRKKQYNETVEPSEPGPNHIQDVEMVRRESVENRPFRVESDVKTKATMFAPPVSLYFPFLHRQVELARRP